MKYTMALTFVLAFSALPAKAVTYTHAELAEHAELFLKNELAHLDGETQLKASALDARMPERSCESPLESSIAGNQTPDRQATVQIECTDLENQWRLFIPVRIQQVQTVVVAAHTLSPGHIIGPQDVHVTEIDVQQVRDSLFINPEQLIGAKVKRRIASQQAIQARHTCFVCRGEDVTIITEVGSLQIQATGVARNDGLLGERIVVKNSRSNKELQGVVTAMGEVTVGR